MNFLKVYIDEETLSLIKENNTDMMIHDIEANRDNVIKVIDYLQEIGVKVIGTLLIEKPDLFLLDVEEIKSHFDNYDMKLIVRMINDDISNFDLV